MLVIVSSLYLLQVVTCKECYRLEAESSELISSLVLHQDDGLDYHAKYTFLVYL